jgi:hypothetical protein
MLRAQIRFLPRSSSTTESSTRPEFGWITGNLCDLSRGYVCYRDWGHDFLAAAGSRDVDAVAALHEFRQAASVASASAVAQRVGSP